MQSFNFATPFARFFKLLGENFGLFAMLGLISLVLPSMALTYAMRAYTDIPFGQQMTDFSFLNAQNIGIFIAAILAMVAFNLATLSMITEVSILRAVGKPIKVGSIIGHGVVNILPLLAITILVGLMVGLGAIALLIPGLFLAICTCIAVPCYVGEPGRGIFGSISRSFELTERRRWWLLLIFIVAFLLLLIVSAILGGILVVAGLATGTSLQDAGTIMADSLPIQLLSSAIDSVTTLVSNVFIAALYVSLRETRERLTPDNAADVFK